MLHPISARFPAPSSSSSKGLVLETTLHTRCCQTPPEPPVAQQGRTMLVGTPWSTPDAPGRPV
eukprot:4623275-Amphidinium_carterae.1